MKAVEQYFPLVLDLLDDVRLNQNCLAITPFCDAVYWSLLRHIGGVPCFSLCIKLIESCSAVHHQSSQTLLTKYAEQTLIEKTFWYLTGFLIVCNGDALGMKDKLIPNSALSASSFEPDSPPSSGRIYSFGGWRALRNDTSPYLEVSETTTKPQQSVFRSSVQKP